MKVCEIFSSVQGESTYTGLPCTFIRLSGCNLRCKYCDTTYAYDEGAEYSVDKLTDEAGRRGMGLVEITGGEPLLQKGVWELVTRLSDGGFTVLLETNGSIGIEGLDPRTTVIMDVKAPGSGMSGETDLANLGLLKPSDEVKFVLTDRADYEWARDFMRNYRLEDTCKVLLSPVFGVLDPRKLAGWMMGDGLGARLNLQLHKYIFGPERTGV